MGDLKDTWRSGLYHHGIEHEREWDQKKMLRDEEGFEMEYIFV